MIAVHFDKSRAAKWIECLNSNKPIEGFRGGHDYLTLAGIFYFAILSHGPIAYSVAGIDLDTLSDERREAVWIQHQKELLAAVGACADLAEAVFDEEFDSVFAPQVQMAVFVDGDGNHVVNFVKGHKAKDSAASD